MPMPSSASIREVSFIFTSVAPANGADIATGELLRYAGLERLALDFAYYAR